MKKLLKSKKILDKFFSIIELKSLKGLTVVLAAVCIVTLITLGYSFQKKNEPEIISDYKGIKIQADEPIPSDKPPAENIFVHIKGEVNSPGLYELEKDCRVIDAINAAGGFTDSASVDSVNLAEKLSDEAELYIPSKSEPKSTPRISSSGGRKSSATAEKIKVVNINTASAPELMTLPGIGGVYASRIIDFRQENGPYDRIEDIMKVKGISKGKFDMIKDYIRV